MASNVFDELDSSSEGTAAPRRGVLRSLAAAAAGIALTAVPLAAMADNASPQKKTKVGPTGPTGPTGPDGPAGTAGTSPTRFFTGPRGPEGNTGAYFVPKIVQVTATGSISSNSTGSVQADCARNQGMAGSGYDVGTIGNVFIRRITPENPSFGVYDSDIGYRNLNNTSADVSAFVYCIDQQLSTDLQTTAAKSKKRGRVQKVDVKAMQSYKGNPFAHLNKNKKK